MNHYTALSENYPDYWSHFNIYYIANSINIPLKFKVIFSAK